MALVAVGIFGMVGLAVDLGRVFVLKNETQVYCDSAAVAAALALDGSAAGIAKAQSAATVSTNKWNFGTASLIPSVKFATTAAGPWVASPASGAGYTYVSVAASVAAPLYFLPLVTGQGTFTVVSSATAGQIPITSIARGLSPYSAVSTNPAGPNFGLVPGSSYDIHWPNFNGHRSGCSAASPDNCFVSPPCADESAASKAAVVTNWGSSLSGYWGSNSNSQIASAVLNGTQLAPVAVGANMDSLLTNGNKQSEAGYLDQRASQDTNTTDNIYTAYLSSSTHNGRRLLAVAILDPVDPTHTNVIGFGQFLLMADGSPSNYYKSNTKGNDPYCAIYAGSYNIGSVSPGAGGTTGASVVRLVQ